MRRVVPLLIVLCLGFAPAPVYRIPLDRRPDLEQLQGVWLLVAELQGGRSLAARNLKAVISGSTLEWHEGGRIGSWEITLDPRSVPKELDQRSDGQDFFPGGGGPGGGGGGRGRGLKAVYSIDGDMLRICYDTADWSERPKDLTGGGPYHHLRYLRRKKP